MEQIWSFCPTDLNLKQCVYTHAVVLGKPILVWLCDRSKLKSNVSVFVCCDVMKI
jgi:hypothetical protein